MVLGYRHAYHAASHADILKHTTFSLLLQSLTEKHQAKQKLDITNSLPAKPFFVLDTHAAAGVYKLSSPHTQKLREYTEGLLKINWYIKEKNGDSVPDCIAEFWRCLSYFNNIENFEEWKKSIPRSKLQNYPGSPAISLFVTDAVRNRNGDNTANDTKYIPSLAHIYLNELHSTEVRNLKEFVERYTNQDPVEAHNKGNDINGFGEYEEWNDGIHKVFVLDKNASLLGSSFPLFYSQKSQTNGSGNETEKNKGRKDTTVEKGDSASYPRGIVLIDPSYEVEKDYSDTIRLIKQIQFKQPQTVQMIWYPLLASPKKTALIDQFIKEITDLKIEKSLRAQMLVEADYRLAKPDEKDSGERVTKRTSLYGSGVIIINPPYLFDNVLSQDLLPFLSRSLSNLDPSESIEVQWLNPEKIRS